MKSYGLWYNIHAKRKRIKNGSNERMRKPGSKGAPTDSDFKNASEEFENIMERGEDSKGYYRSTEDGAGLTRKGAKAMGVKTAVTTPPSKLDPDGKAAKRRKSFCARMSGMKGPMKDEKGRPTRKAMSLKRWNCNEELFASAKKSKVLYSGEYKQALNTLENILKRKKDGKSPLYYAARVAQSYPHVDAKELLKMTNKGNITEASWTAATSSPKKNIKEGKITVFFKKGGFEDKDVYGSEEEAKKGMKILKDNGFIIKKIIGMKKLEEEDMNRPSIGNLFQTRIDNLLRSGFVEKSEIAAARKAIQKINMDKPLTSEEKLLIQSVFKKLLDLVSKDNNVYGMVKRSIDQHEPVYESAPLGKVYGSNDAFRKPTSMISVHPNHGMDIVYDKQIVGTSENKKVFFFGKTQKGRDFLKQYFGKNEHMLPDDRGAASDFIRYIKQRKLEVGPMAHKDMDGSYSWSEEVEIDESIKVGDKVHVAMKQKGGAGYRGKVHKVDGDHVYIQLPDEGKWGNRIVRGHLKHAIKEENEIAEGDIKKANKAKKNNYVSSIIQKKIHPSVLPSLKYGRRSLNSEETIEEGRPSQRHPLEGHEYHKKKDNELQYIIKDAGKAREAMKGHDEKAENKYADQVNDAATVLYFRQKNGMPDWYKKKYGHMKHLAKEETEIVEGDIKKANKAKKNNYVASIIQKKLHPSVLPSLKYGRRSMKTEELENISEEGDPPIQHRSLYAKTYAKHGGTVHKAKEAKQKGYEAVSKKYGSQAAEKLKSYHDKNYNMSEEVIKKSMESGISDITVKELLDDLKETSYKWSTAKKYNPMTAYMDDDYMEKHYRKLLASYREMAKRSSNPPKGGISYPKEVSRIKTKLKRIGFSAEDVEKIIADPLGHYPSKKN